MEKIDFIIVDTKKERARKVKEAFLTITDEYIQYKVDYFRDEDDEALGWVENVYTYFNQYASKETVRGVNLHYKSSSDKWTVNIHLSGFAEDMWVNFDDEAAARSMFTKLLKWKYPQPKA